MKRLATIAVLAAAAAAGFGCRSLYYGTMEKFGIHKRDIMVDRVEEAREAQQDAKKQFKSALEQFTTVVRSPGGDLESKYNKLNRALERSEERAAEVRSRIASVEQVSKDLFREWQAELKQYTNPELRRGSERQLDETRRRYDDLIAAMKKAESRLEPVLAVFRDQVLFLKHNLNARAIASLKDELVQIETRVDELVREMENSIREADEFIRTIVK